MVIVMDMFHMSGALLGVHQSEADPHKSENSSSMTGARAAGSAPDPNLMEPNLMRSHPVSRGTSLISTL